MENIKNKIKKRITLRSGESMGSSRCRGGEHAPNGLAARASTGYAGAIFEELCGFPLPQLPDIFSDGLRSVFLCRTFLGHRLAAQESLLHKPHCPVASSGVQQLETPQQHLRCMRTAISGGVQCLQMCICIRAVRLSRFVELSQLSGGFLTESSLVLRHSVACEVPGKFQAVVLSLSCLCCQRCDVAEQLSRSVTQVRIKTALQFGVAWKLCRPLSSGRLLLGSVSYTHLTLPTICSV